jgi:hypothetical protein
MAAKKIMLLVWFVVVGLMHVSPANAVTPENRVWENLAPASETHLEESAQAVGTHQEKVSWAEETASGCSLAAKALPQGARLTQQALEHIVERHWFTSGAQNAGKFAEGTTARELKALIQDATSTGVSRSNTRGRLGTIFEKDFGSTIGTDIGGNAASRLRVVTRPDGTVVTAFPY